MIRRGIVTMVLALATVAAMPEMAAAHGAAEAPPSAKLRQAEPSETVRTRQRFFGAENVNGRTGEVRRDKLILSWFGVTNFAMAIRGHVVLLDAWVPRGSHTGYVPTSPQELASLDPEAIFIGHAHFDHAADAVPIAQASGATVVGSAEQCEELKSRVTLGPALSCREALPPGSFAGQVGSSDALSGVDITAIKHIHSGPTGPDLTDREGPHVPVIPPPASTVVEKPPTPQDLIQLLGTLPDSEAGSVLWRFRAGGFSFVWHDTSGPLDDLAPEAFRSLRDLRPVDLQLGAIQSFNQFTNGMRDARQYIETLRPALFIPSHHDDWAFPITTRAENYRPHLDAELQRIPFDQRPPVRFISDPADYVRPAALTFDIADDDLRLSRRCLRGGRLRAALTGEVEGVRHVRFRLARGASGADQRAPWSRTFSRRSLRRARGGKLYAFASIADGRVRRLQRPLSRCGR